MWDSIYVYKYLQNKYFYIFIVFFSLNDVHKRWIRVFWPLGWVVIFFTTDFSSRITGEERWFILYEKSLKLINLINLREMRSSSGERDRMERINSKEIYVVRIFRPLIEFLYLSLLDRLPVRSRSIQSPYVQFVVNLCISGLQAELFYVREGMVNEYAIKFVVPVPAQIHKLHFTWENLAGRPVSFRSETIRINFLALVRDEKAHAI